MLLVFIKKKVTKVRDTNKLQLNRKTHYVAVVLWVAWSSEKWATFNRQLIVETFNKQELEGARGRPFTTKVQTNFRERCWTPMENLVNPKRRRVKCIVNNNAIITIYLFLSDPGIPET